MNRIHLLRHAKSSWADSSLADHDRPLARRGEDAGTRMAAWIAEHGPHPQLVLCSTATRARQTLEIVLPSFAAAGSQPDVVFEAGLYHAYAETLLDRVRALADDLDDVVLVGHNPGLQELALLLSAPSPERERIAAKLPTGALVSIELDMAWERADRGTGRIAALALPREL